MFRNGAIYELQDLTRMIRQGRTASRDADRAAGNLWRISNVDKASIDMIGNVIDWTEADAMQEQNRLINIARHRILFDAARKSDDDIDTFISVFTAELTDLAENYQAEQDQKASAIKARLERRQQDYKAMTAEQEFLEGANLYHVVGKRTFDMEWTTSTERDGIALAGRTSARRPRRKAAQPPESDPVMDDIGQDAEEL